MDLSTWEIFRNPRMVIVELLVIFLSITLHEFGHAFSADRLGDETPRRQGRVNLWPDRHLDPAGTVMIVITSLMGRGIGWGRPVQVNPYGLKHPRRDSFIITACGPLMNLLLALVFGLLVRFSFAARHIDWMFDGTFRQQLGDYDETIMHILDYAAFHGHLTLPGLFAWALISINLALFIFNLIPIHPLDGSKLLGALLPREQAIRYDRTVGQYGFMILFAVSWLLPQGLWMILGPPIDAASNLLLGHLPSLGL